MAVEFLVRTTDGPAGRYRGDIVAAKPSPAIWGSDEDLPNYLVVLITNVNMAQISSYVARHERQNPEDPGSPQRRSRYGIDLDMLPTNYNVSRPHLTLNKQAIDPTWILRSFE
jgi:hypothetical protein